MTRARSSLLGIGLWLGCLLSSATAQAQDSDLPARLAAFMQAHAEVNGFSGAVLVEQDGKPLLRQGYGLANAEWRIPNTPETVFRLGSITKSYTAMAIMILQEQGKLHVNDPVAKHVPDAPEAWKDVTIHHLLTHTSGIPSFTGFPEYATRKREHLTPEQLVAWFRDRPLDFPPGAGYIYSNSGYILLGFIIEKASGQTYEAFLEQAVLDPLGLEHTYYDHAETVIPHRASGYDAGPDGQARNAEFVDMSVPFAAGALASTVDDVAKWAAANDAQKLVSKAAHEALLTPVRHDYGYGWIIAERHGHRLISHGGGIDGFVTNLDRFPEDKLRIVVLCNRTSVAPHAVSAGLAAIVFGKPVDLPRKRTEITVAPEILDRYVGQYQLAPGVTLDIRREGDHLVGQPSGQSPARLFAESETDFFLKVVDASVTFECDGNGPATALVVHQNGRDTKAPRIEPKSDPKP
jgi:CubicO group peptidase (beta-lactamase class C family)